MKTWPATNAPAVAAIPFPAVGAFGRGSGSAAAALDKAFSFRRTRTGKKLLPMVPRKHLDIKTKHELIYMVLETRLVFPSPGRKCFCEIRFMYVRTHAGKELSETAASQAICFASIGSRFSHGMTPEPHRACRGSQNASRRFLV